MDDQGTTLACSRWRPGCGHHVSVLALVVRFGATANSDWRRARAPWLVDRIPPLDKGARGAAGHPPQRQDGRYAATVRNERSTNLDIALAYRIAPRRKYNPPRRPLSVGVGRTGGCYMQRAGHLILAAAGQARCARIIAPAH